jgi:VIT1/CCC1 family predicted Fe2+/Mn2+ transporter
MNGIRHLLFFVLRGKSDHLSCGFCLAGIDLDARVGSGHGGLAHPLQASLASALCFSIGAAVPLLSAAFVGASSSGA